MENGIEGMYKGIGIYKKENEFYFENGVKIDGKEYEKLLELLE